MTLIDVISEWVKNFNVKFITRSDGVDHWTSDGKEVYGLISLIEPIYPYQHAFWDVFDDSIRFPDRRIVSAADPELFVKLEKSINWYKQAYGINS